MNSPRPKWLKILLTVLCIWDFFLIVLGSLWMIFNPVLARLVDNDNMITPQLLLFVASIFFAGYISSKINIWQEKYLDRKPKSLSFIFVGLLLFLMVLPIMRFLIFN